MLEVLHGPQNDVKKVEKLNQLFFTLITLGKDLQVGGYDWTICGCMQPSKSGCYGSYAAFVFWSSSRQYTTKNRNSSICFCNHLGGWSFGPILRQLLE